jgi:hypothetical protein
VFIVCGLAYVTAWAIIQLLVPRLAPIDIDTRRTT